MPVALSIDGGDGNLFATPTPRVSEIAPSDEVDVRPRTERRCLVTRECRDIGSLVRFVVAPDRTLVPDIEGKLPGRGFWVTAEGSVLDRAVKDGYLARALRRVNAEDVVVPAELCELVTLLLRRRCLSLFGLARRAGVVVVGFGKVTRLLASGGARLLVLAAEGGATGDKLRRSVGNRDGNVKVIDFFEACALAPIFGRVNWACAGVQRCGFAERLLVETNRLDGFTNTKGGMHQLSSRIHKAAR